MPCVEKNVRRPHPNLLNSIATTVELYSYSAPDGDVVVHAAGVDAGDGLYEVSEPGVAGAGVAGQPHHPQPGPELHRVAPTRRVIRPGEVGDVQPQLLL